MSSVNFAHPVWLTVGGLVVAGLLGLMVRAERLRRCARARLAGRRSVVTVARGRRLFKRALVLLGTACAFLALARPRWGFRWETEHRAGVDLMFAVDTSKSMRAQDLRPDRLTRAKLAVTDLLRELPGARAGLIAFAGAASVEAPMTLDRPVFDEALDALDTGVVAYGGTNLGAAIDAAIAAMASEPDHHKVLVILSDGEDLAGDALAAAQRAARAGLVVDAVGVGTPAGELVPVDHAGHPGLMRDAEGHPVRSRLDEPTLRRLTATTGGAYAALGPDGRGLEALYHAHLATLPRGVAEERMHKVGTERFEIPLAIAVACLLAELCLGERRRRAGAGRVVALGAATALILLAGGEHPAAAATVAAGSASVYNDGTTAYRKRDFPAATERFQRATRTSDLGVQEDAYYDLGNARYRLGQAALSKGTDRSAAIAAWREALAAYDGALALQPKDLDAKYNRDLVTRRLAALEREQQPPPSPKPNQADGNNAKDQGGQGQNGPGQKSQGQKGAGQASNSAQAGQSQAQDRGAGNPTPGASGETQASPNGNGGSAAKSGGAAPSRDDAQPKGTNQGGNTRSPGESAEAQPADQGNGATQPSGSAQAPRSGNASGQPAERSQDGGRARSGAQPIPPTSTPTPTGPGVVGSGVDQKPGGSPATGSSGGRRDPNALTHDEATQLLDSVSGEMRRLPAAGDSRRPMTTDDQPEKDW